MKNYPLIKFEDLFVRSPRLGRNNGVRQFLCVSLVLLLSISLSQGRPGGGGGSRGGGGGSRGSGFAPGVSTGSAGAGSGQAGAGAGGVGATGSGPGTSAGAGGTSAGAGAPGAGATPNNYRSTVPAGTANTYYRGYSCYYVDGAYYRPVYYEGAVVYTEVPADTATLPEGYYYSIPPGFTTVAHGGYTCYYVGNVYYRIVNYNGIQVFQVVP